MRKQITGSPPSRLKVARPSAARRALNAVRTGARPSGEKPLAQVALLLSCLMTIALLGFLLWMLLGLLGH